MAPLVSISNFLSNFCEQLFTIGSPMMFYNGLFWFLMLLFLPIYAMLKNRRYQMMMFVASFSIFFAYKASGWVCLFMVGTALIDWFIAKKIATIGIKKEKKLLATVAIVLSLGLLIFFKYTNFLLSNLSTIAQRNFQPLDLVAPIGISFYTFRTISYIVDVYKGKCAPAEDWLEYLFYLTFFPCLIAGPVVRAKDFLPQIRENKSADKAMIYGGLYLFLIGVVKKALFADYISQYVNIAFGNPAGYSGFELFMASVGYSLQLYCDFSGYSDMAIGLGAILGYNLGINFDFPFRSLNITEFWRRWHITLSFWIRDYLYIPLGGNRKGKIRQYINLMVSMLLGGLWHGASWNYIIWGGGHGVALCIHKAFKKPLDKVKNSGIVKFFSWLLTFLVCNFLFVFFRAESFAEAKAVLGGIFTNFDLAYLPPFVSARVLLCIMIVIVFALHFVPQRFYDKLRGYFVISPWIVKLLVMAAVIALVLHFASADVKPFIYAQY